MPGVEAVNVDEMEINVPVTDIAELLFQQFVIITGGKSKERCPIITFPDNGLFHTLPDYDYKRLISFITTVPSLHEADNGFVLIVDRRNDKWSSVKHILFKFTEFFPGLIHIVYVLRPEGFLQKAISEVSNKFFKEDFKFKVLICNNIEELHQCVDKSELTVNLHGDLSYQHEEWIQQRIALEQFSLQMRSISHLLDDFTQYIRVITDMLPVSIDDAVSQLNDHTSRYKNLKQNIVNSSTKGEELLSNMKHGNQSSQLPPSAINNISAVERLLVQLDETDHIFDEFWEHHACQLKQSLELRTFDRDFNAVKTKLFEYLKAASEMNEIGESVEHVDALIEDLNKFHTLCQREIGKSEELMQRGDQILDSQRYIDVDRVELNCDELRMINQSLAEKLLQRIDVLKKLRVFQLRIKKANTWCAQGIEVLGSQNIEKFSMFPEKVEQVLTELEQFVASADTFNVAGSDDLYNLFEDCITLETKALVTQVLQRIEDVTVMCEKRITNLRRLLLRPNRPVQPVSPEMAVTTINIRETNAKPNDKKATMLTNGINGRTVEPLTQNGVCHDQIIELVHAQSKQYHILKELLETERLYVLEMKTIITGYKEMMYNDQTKALVPNELFGKEDILFCNIDEICHFHGENFLPELCSDIFDISKVATLFVKQKDEFLRLYSYYCQNVIKSDKLRDQVGERNEFFLACQVKLGHKLPLAAYMLKPVQRITKYQLLLKDLINNIDNEKHVNQLQLALDCMLLVLKCVNDRMHQISITGFKGVIAEQGDMLLQASFNVWVENKKDLLKELRLKPLRRHIFLYRKAMLFCKKSSSHTKGKYQFKGMLKMSKIGLTETVKGDPRKFEVWLEGRQEIYIIQAATVQQKETWVKEIKNVLFGQLTELKGEKLKEYAEKWPFRTFSLESANSQSGCNSRGTSRPNSHHEVSDDSLSDLSNSEDEDSISTNIIGANKYVVLADYCAIGQHEISLREGDKLELLKYGSAGWWYIKLTNGSEGWVPAAYLEPKECRKAIRSVASSSSQQSVGSQLSTDAE